MRGKSAAIAGSGEGHASDRAITLSSVESLLGIIIGVLTAVFPMTWLFKAGLMAVLLIIFAHWAFRCVGMFKVRNVYKWVATALITVLLSTLSYGSLQNQRMEEQNNAKLKEYTPIVLENDSSVTLTLKCAEMSAKLRDLDADLRRRMKEIDETALRNMRKDAKEQVELGARRMKDGNDIYRAASTEFKSRYLTPIRSLEAELLSRAGEMYIGPRGVKMPPPKLPQRALALNHGDCLGPSPLAEVADYLQELEKLR